MIQTVLAGLSPLENKEYGVINTDWAFQATTDSEAYGKYDLLIHETGASHFGTKHKYSRMENYSDMYILAAEFARHFPDSRLLLLFLPLLQFA